MVSRKDMMSEDLFWELIDKTKGGDPQDQLDSLIAELSVRPIEDILGFDYRLDKYLENSYNPELWAAAYIICGGCTDDEFDIFRAWLISQGRDVYENALKDPDSLYEVCSKMGRNEYPENEEILYAALDSYEEATGKEDFYDVLDTFEDDFMMIEIELNWDEDDPKTLRNICPKLFDLYYENIGQ
ncbi:DUF4240 domain-containing protein [Methanolapillus millepedarum]|uniref:DUF4240 domain-containing protein n=1 Tax=Methanolapillus millepedarum TaxID=3028296 RepID=A0AA96V557_9EURY|nr:hypothetical protein MsAc7_15930 [Methanosarcinaceae archaeon Ac7]